MFVKAPEDILDYEWDWSTWLPTGDTIATVSFTAADGLIIESNPAVSNTATTATAFISGGAAGESYAVTCQITTAGGRTAQWTQNINVVNL